MCSETSSPRLSFSRDAPTEVQRRDTSLVDCEDFEFSFSTSLSLSLSQSSADQLFSHGIITPTQPTNTTPIPSSSSPRSHLLVTNSNKNSSDEEEEEEEEQTKAPTSKATSSFWGGFKRSASLNCEKSKKSGLLCSLPPILSRSNSTGSSSQKQPLISAQRSSSLKPPLKKKKGYYGNTTGNSGVRVIPVINVPPPYISKGTAKLFGLGSFLHHGKHRTTTTATTINK